MNAVATTDTILGTRDASNDSTAVACELSFGVAREWMVSALGILFKLDSLHVVGSVIQVPMHMTSKTGLIIIPTSSLTHFL